MNSESPDFYRYANLCKQQIDEEKQNNTITAIV